MFHGINIVFLFQIGMFVSNTPAWEMEKSRHSVTYTLCFNVAAMVIFSMLAATTSDAVQSKPLTGLAGLCTATLAAVAGFGFCCYIGIRFISLNMAAPFLLLGIGIDDTFVMLSAWRRSSKRKSLPERMGRYVK
jgi:patched domain-containing protein